MATITFQLPAGLSRELARELEARSCLAGGQDNMPLPAQVRVDARSGHLIVLRDTDESVSLVAPWLVDGVGKLMGSSATLMQRPTPYGLLTELARGKINQVRCQAADWQAGGVQLAGGLEERIQAVSVAFGQAVCAGAEERPGGSEDTTRNRDQAGALSDPSQDRCGLGFAGANPMGVALGRGYQAAQDLVEAYVAQVLQFRHQHQPRLETFLSGRLAPSLLNNPPLGAALARTFNQVVLPLSWHAVEADEASYRWDETDRLLAWAQERGLPVSAGPLIDFSSAQLPAWLWLWERDLPSMATFMCRFVESAVRRYRTRVRRWQVCAAGNCASVLGLGEDELLGLAYRLGEAARNVDPSLELVLGIAQPWGEYLAQSERSYSPFLFADHLVRTGLGLAGLDIELVQGLTGRGSYCRDLLETSRLLDLYALLGVPLTVTLGYPHSAEEDPDADPETRVGAGHWGDGYTPQTQASFARAFGGLCLAKMYVQGVQWAHFTDADPHLFPNCGLVDRAGQLLPAQQALADLREQHLR